jgi:hypothetical protein
MNPFQLIRHIFTDIEKPAFFKITENGIAQRMARVLFGIKYAWLK